MQSHDDHVRREGETYVFAFLENPARTYNAIELRKYVNKRAPSMPESWRANMDRIIALLERLDENNPNRSLSLKDLIA